MKKSSEIHLELRRVSKSFGGLQAVQDVSFQINGPELIGLIGPNGAGKTTLTNLIDGALNPTSGTIYFNKKRIDGLKSYQVARVGVGRTFQVTRAFRRMTVLENMMVPGLALHATAHRREVEKKAWEVLEFLTFEHLANDYARSLSGGQQKLLELGRLLMLDPQIIILDEPFAGVHPKLMEKIYEYITTVNAQGKAFIIISHDMDTIFTLSKRLLVLNFGELIADGAPKEVRHDPAVVEAYLGEDEEEYGLSIEELAAKSQTGQTAQEQAAHLERGGEDNG